MKEDNITVNDVEKEIERCSCPECGFEDELGIDDISCDEKTCKQCGAKMMTSLKQQNEELINKLKSGTSVEDKLKILVEHNEGEETIINQKVGTEPKSTESLAPKRRYGKFYEGEELQDTVNPEVNYKTKYHCNKCGIVISESVHAQESVCPKCGDDFAILENASVLDSERRFICPECNSSFRYTKINEDCCTFCHSMMTVYDNPTINKSKTAITTD